MKHNCWGELGNKWEEGGDVRTFKGSKKKIREYATGKRENYMANFWIKEMSTLVKRNACGWRMTVWRYIQGHLFLQRRNKLLQVMQTEARIDKSWESSECGLCGKVNEIMATNHGLRKCCKLAYKEFKR